MFLPDVMNVRSRDQVVFLIPKGKARNIVLELPNLAIGETDGMIDTIPNDLLFSLQALAFHVQRQSRRLIIRTATSAGVTPLILVA